MKIPWDSHKTRRCFNQELAGEQKIGYRCSSRFGNQEGWNQEEGRRKENEILVEMQSGRIEIQTLRNGLVWTFGRIGKNYPTKTILQLRGRTQNQHEQSKMSLEAEDNNVHGEGAKQTNNEPNCSIDDRRREGAVFKH